MKILYVTARWDPNDPDSGSGVNYQAYSALHAKVQDINICGPFDTPPTLIERGITRIAAHFTKKRFIKFYPSYIRQSNHAVEEMMAAYQPDVIVSKSSIPLVNVRLSVPLVYICDSSVRWVKRWWLNFSKLGFWFMERWEKKVINKATHIITFSQVNADMLIDYYHKPPQQITVHPMPSALPHHLSSYQERSIAHGKPIHLLLVGKDYHRKGVDIAIEATNLCNQNGIPAQLRVVGQDGKDSDFVRFMGLYSKSNPVQLNRYIDNYCWAHFMIFPSRFDAAGIVPSEAAGFGVPTITNAAGGLATTVKHGQSGIVLEKNSPADAYFKIIQYYWKNPMEYQTLRGSTFQRYQRTLNWEVFGDRMFSIIQDVLSHNRIQK